MHFNVCHTHLKKNIPCMVGKITSMSWDEMWAAHQNKSQTNYESGRPVHAGVWWKVLKI